MSGGNPKEDLERAEDLFHRALEVEPHARAAFLESECGGDARLRDDVLSLLESDTRTGGPLVPPGAATMAQAIRTSSLGPAPGARVGAFVLLERIGAGAMGTVWRAERADKSYTQHVAVKLLPPGLESDETLARFRRERAMLARLEHPGIARLIDGGATENGVPYLVMEYVDGLPIDRFCEERRLPVEARLALFVEVCDAVQAAHRSLVVHRDLKPANILVDTTGRARLLDFGIAKLLDRGEDGAREADLTFAGERLMTPRYASPEQVRGEPVTTATDVYSLGVLLYEILSGRLPYRTPADTVRELETAILDQEPEKPSAAARRAPGKADVARRLAGDIDTIVLRAMAKEPAARYPSAESLAEDVRRHLRGQPVLARKDTLAYRASKFVKRHRLAVAAAAAAALVALASAVAIVRSARLASERLTDVLRLSDLTRLSDYTAEAESLFPALPDKVRDFEAWLAKARDLARSLPEHRSSLDAIRARALPYDDAAREADRRADPKSGRLEDLLVQLESTRARIERDPERAAELRRRLEEIEGEIAAIGSPMPSRRTWRFASVEEQWQHDKLAELVAGLEAFSAEGQGLVARVEGRLERARTIRADSIESHRAEWAAAIASIRDPFECPAYGGLVLAPQLGLVPLGRDPESGLHEFAHVATGTVPARAADGKLAIGEGTGLVFVLVPGGTFLMGAEAKSGDAAARPDESPRHDVALDPFFLSKYEMTQGQWSRFTGSNPSVYRAGQKHGSVMLDLRHPVDSVTWEECERTLGRMRLALPTEAQWEYAARAGTATPWWTGADRESLRGAANLADAAAARNGAAWQTVRDWPGYDDGHVVHAPADAFRANPWGFANVAGNVWEWCADEYAGYDVPVEKGTGLRRWKGTPTRSGRGGSFMEAAVSLRSAHRGNGPTNVRQTSIGVRPALAIRNEPEPR